MSDWPNVSIGDVADIFDGPHATPKTVDAGPVFLGIGSLQRGRINLGETRHVTPEDFGTWTRRVKPRPGDVVFSYETRIGEAAIIPEGLLCCLGRRMGLVRAHKSRLDSRFFLYTYLSPSFQDFLRSRTITGSTVDRIALTEFPTFAIPLPPIAEQRAIAAILAAFDEKIDLNRRTNETLETIARAIFKDWFVDFGPTRAKMEGQAPYFAPELWALFPERLDDEGKPDGWLRGALGGIADILMGASPDGTTYNDVGIGTPLVNGPVEYGDYFLRRVKWTTAPGRLSQEGDLIICVRGSTTGRHAYADGVYCLGRGVAAVRARDGHVEFVASMVLSELSHLLQRTTGSVFPNLSSDDIREFTVLIPGAALRMAFCKRVRPLRELVWANVRESDSLATTRDLLLPKLMSGELRVKDAERLVEAVA